MSYDTNFPLKPPLPPEKSRFSVRAQGCVDRCAGCSHRDLTEEESVLQKQTWLARALEPWVDVIEEIKTPPSTHRFGYRNKVLLSARYQEGHWRFGMLRRVAPRSREYELIEIPECPVHSERVRTLCQFFSKFLPATLPLVYLSVSGEFVTLVLKTRAQPVMIPDYDYSKLGLKGVFLNFNPSAGRRVFHHRSWVRIWGEEVASASGFLYGPKSFQQLIPSLHESSLSTAFDFLRPATSDSVMDLYSGIGTSLSLWKKAGARVLGVEMNSEAVELSRRNCSDPEISLCGRVSDRLPQLREFCRNSLGKTLVYANPPRLGIEPEVLGWLVSEVRPERIGYLSCSAGTLAKDLSRLTREGYTVRRIIPYDFFPQTHHVEILALLERNSNFDFSRTLSPGSNTRT